MALTTKQEMFCKEYLVDLNATQAAIRAGYSKETAQQMGSENLSKPVIAEMIQSLMAERSQRVQIDADYVLGGIKELTERCIQAQPVIIEGRQTGEYKFEPQAALKGYEMMGRHLKLFTDKTEHSGSVNIQWPLAPTALDD